MSLADITAPPEREAHQRPGEALPERGTGLLRFRRRTIGQIVTTVVLAIFATLLGPLGALQSASATVPDKDSIARWKIGDRNSYGAFLNAIRSAVNVGDPHIPGSSRQINHTSGDSAHTSYFNVDVEEAHSQRFVTLRLRASDLYLMGWWGGARGEERYHAVDAQPDPPVRGDRHDNGLRPVRAPFAGNYSRLPDREQVEYSVDSLSNAVLTLIRAPERSNGNQTNAQRTAFLLMAQSVSEAARFRPMAEFVQTAQVKYVHEKLSGHYVSMQNRWKEFSDAVNYMLAAKVSLSDRAPTQYVYRAGKWTLLTISTVQIATQLLMTALGKPKK
ncbi:ribosome-inactivating family protein [Streptomyces sp. NPDC058678]|uniref:ribosome-inactivating family protein n=1 Tax=Streptomyces sp. NPDC058678 TaxID=3346595 RepID=UPI003653A944